MVTPMQRAALEAHIRGERTGQVDAALAPLADEPTYVIPGYVLVGKEAVRRLYEFVLPQLPLENFDEYLCALDDPEVAFWGENHLVLEYTDAYPNHRNMVVVVHFEGDRVKSENTYYRTLAQPGTEIDTVFADVDGAVPID